MIRMSQIKAYKKEEILHNNTFTEDLGATLKIQAGKMANSLTFTLICSTFRRNYNTN